MNITSLSASQLRHAAAIKEKIETLQKELNQILGAVAAPATVTPGAANRAGKMSAAAKAKLSAKLKLIWAKRKAAQQAVAPAAKPAPGKMSPAARAKLSAKLKAYWAKRKKAAKK